MAEFELLGLLFEQMGGTAHTCELISAYKPLVHNACTTFTTCGARPVVKVKEFSQRSTKKACALDTIE